MSAFLTPLQRLQTRLISTAVAPAISVLCRTLTWKVEGAEHYERIIQSGRQPIIAFWHGRILPATWFFRNRGIVALTSANFDGQWIARVIEQLGNRTVAGSSSRGGARALIQLKRESMRGHPVAFALDGPRGPARIPQPGAMWLAAATGNPILPFHAESSRHWQLSSWDRTQVPRPFSRVAIVVGEPIEARGSDAHLLDRTGLELTSALAALERRAHELLG
jgi:lysophospholipid acyltransferase (LPLAT)-like uncharacterized protein